MIGIGRGWHVAPAHFAERHELIVLIALGESIIAIGVGAELHLGTGVLATAALGMVVVSALWWLYFDVDTLFVAGGSSRRSDWSEPGSPVTPTATSTYRST